MKIEYHNAHGSQLILKLTKNEAVEMINGLAASLLKTNLTDISHYVKFKTEFENDNDRWVPTDLDVLVEGDRRKTERDGCQPTFPCGKHVEKMGSIPAGPCDREEGHDWGCMRRNARPVYET